MKNLTFLALLIVLASSALADPGWLLTTGDLRQQPVALDGIDANGVRMTPVVAQPSMLLGYDVFLQLDRASAARGGEGKFTLFLAGGDRISGEPTGYKDEQVQWRSSGVGDLNIPLKSARTLVRSSFTAEELDQPRTEDKVLMNNGDSVKGIVTNIDQAKVTIQADSALDIPLDSIRCIYFAAAGKSKASTGRAFRVRIGDGSIITAAEVRLEGAGVRLTLADKSIRTVPLAAVFGIEQLNGPVSWLSSRQPEQAVQVPYFGSRPWPTRMDATVGGRPIQFSGRTYAHGIGVHAYSRVDYALDGSYEAFRTQYAMSQEEKRQYADVTVRIKLDGKVVHEQVGFRADVLSPAVVIDLPREAKLLTLEVAYGAANDTQDRFNWIEPALLRKKPITPTTQP